MVSHPLTPTRLPPMLRIALWALLIFSVLYVVYNHGADAADYDADFQQQGLPDQVRFDEPFCPEYQYYSTRIHPPFSAGPMKLSFQRPAIPCRTFKSSLVEKVIDDMKANLVDKDLARLFENAFPNTLDTTVKWHVNGTEKKVRRKKLENGSEWNGPHSFIVTGDINAEWLRDSTNQLAQYQALAKKDKAIENLILGAIATQAEYVIGSPYCNAFHPPPPSNISPSGDGASDDVHPVYDPDFVFECKYELDSLAHFLKLGNEFYRHTDSDGFLNSRWFLALESVLQVLDEQSAPTFDPETNAYVRNTYTFQRRTKIGTETLSLHGVGNPLNDGTGLVRSAFRPSDDASILGFFIPANAMMSVELNRTAEIVRKAGKTKLASNLEARSKKISDGIWEHAVVNHKKFGKVFAFEVDGFGSHILMDDANLPSLLALPLLGFVKNTNEVYQNTRKMILQKSGNPYFLQGKELEGIGGPHIGLSNAWPMSILVQAMTSNDDLEITKSLGMVKNVSGLGLIHESVNVNLKWSYTRSWFAWANSVFAQTILDLAERKPHLLFGPDAEPYVI